CSSVSFFFNDAPPTELYTLSLHDALPIFPVLGSGEEAPDGVPALRQAGDPRLDLDQLGGELLGDRSAAGVRPLGGVDRLEVQDRSEEHTSELQSRENLVCRLLLEKKKNTE